MFKRVNPVWAALFVTCGLAAITAYMPLRAGWGLDHLKFLSSVAGALFALMVIVTVVLLTWRREPNYTVRGIESFSHFLFERGNSIRLLLALFSGLVFWLMRTPTHFLGDGYTLISSMGKGDSYIIKWTESGTIKLIRFVQSLLGGYTRETSLEAFQIVSVASGVVVVYNLILIIRRLTTDSRLRVFAFAVLFGSGGLLLFCGYTEYYPFLWATVTSLFALTVRYAQTGRGGGWVALVFAVSCAAHLQSLVFLPGLVYLFGRVELQQKRQIAMTRSFVVAALTVSGIAAAAYFYMYTTRIEFESIFLPIFTGRSRSPEYAILSPKHLLDIVNQFFLVCPLILPLLALSFRRAEKASSDQIVNVFGMFAVGSLLFLFIVDPVIGLGRDWDLMSLTVLPSVLFLLTRVNLTKFELSPRAIVASALVGFTLAGMFLAVNLGTTSSENRMHELLRYYGAKNRSGWVIFANYFLEKGNEDKWREIGKERETHFPEDAKLVKAYDLLAKGQYQRVLAISRELLKLDPYRGDYYQILGNVWGKLKQYDSAEANYRTAVKLVPYAPMLRNELGQLLLNEQKFDQAVSLFKQVRSFDHSIGVVAEGLALGYYFLGFSDSAIALADSLFMVDRNSPGGHLIYMIVAIQDGDQEAARFHFEQFLTYGKARSDWAPLKEHYKFLSQ